MNRLAVFILSLFLSLATHVKAETDIEFSTQKGITTQKKKQQPKAKAKTQQTRTKSKAKTKQPTAKKDNETISGLKAQKSKVEQQRKASMKKNEELKLGVKRGMENLMALDTEIARQRNTVDTIRRDISTLDDHINLLDKELIGLEAELSDRRQRYMKSMRYMHRNRSAQSRMAFVLSADNFNQMLRRMRFNREYAAFQKAQGEAIVAKQNIVTQKRYELSMSKKQKDTLLAKGEHAQRQLEGKQTEQKAQVEKLKREQKTVQALIEQQQKQEAELNARIDQLIAEEIAREKARLEAEARRRAAEEAAREKKRQQALAEQRRKEQQSAAEQRGGSGNRKTSEANDRSNKGNDRSTAENSRSDRRETTRFRMPSEDIRLSGNFEANQGRLPLPITGAYQLIRGFGTYSPEGLSKVRLQSNGWHLKGQSGAQAQCIFDGIVSGVYYQGGSYIVTVRHGKYISVYINLATVSVRNGQKVTTRQAIGHLGADNTMQFQLRNWSTLLNPAKWLRR